jgi:hypothetical protein
VGDATSHRAAKTPFERVVDDLSGGCGCACHTGTGYRTSCEHCHPHATVQGKCPACGSTGLFAGSGGYLTCPWIKCPDPTAPSKALGIEFPESK